MCFLKLLFSKILSHLAHVEDMSPIQTESSNCVSFFSETFPIAFLCSVNFFKCFSLHFDLCRSHSSRAQLVSVISSSWSLWFLWPLLQNQHFLFSSRVVNCIRVCFGQLFLVFWPLVHSRSHSSFWGPVAISFLPFPDYISFCSSCCHQQ